jgi:hypothetical protein
MIGWLDFYFPFFIFFYGLVMIVVLENPFFRRLGRERMTQYYEQFELHRKVAIFSLCLGGLWSMQNMWL